MFAVRGVLPNPIVGGTITDWKFLVLVVPAAEAKLAGDPFVFPSLPLKND